MAKFVGKYELVKNTNFLEFLLSYGLPEDKAKALDAKRFTNEILFDGKNLTIKTDGTQVSEFILNEEVEEKIPPDTVLKTTATITDDAIVLSSRNGDNETGSRTYKLEGNKLICHIKGSKQDATREFKKL